MSGAHMNDDDIIVFAANTNAPATLRLTSGTFDDEFNLLGDAENSGDLDIVDRINNAVVDGNLTIQGNGIDVTIVEGGASTATGIDRVFGITGAATCLASTGSPTTPCTIDVLGTTYVNIEALP